MHALATPMPAKHNKLTVVLNQAELDEFNQALELQQQRNGDLRKVKVAPLLRDLVMSWTRQELKQSKQGSLFEEQGSRGSEA